MQIRKAQDYYEVGWLSVKSKKNSVLCFSKLKQKRLYNCGRQNWCMLFLTSAATNTQLRQIVLGITIETISLFAQENIYQVTHGGLKPDSWFQHFSDVLFSSIHHLQRMAILILLLRTKRLYWHARLRLQSAEAFGRTHGARPRRSRGGRLAGSLQLQCNFPALRGWCSPVWWVPVGSLLPVLCWARGRLWSLTPMQAAKAGVDGRGFVSPVARPNTASSQGPSKSAGPVGSYVRVTSFHICWFAFYLNFENSFFRNISKILNIYSL